MAKTKSILTKAQRWARERNTSKGQISALTSLSRIVADKVSTLSHEKEALHAIIVVLGKVLGDWKDNESLSKTKYLISYK
jgi:hypothetical protein